MHPEQFQQNKTLSSNELILHSQVAKKANIFGMYVDDEYDILDSNEEEEKEDLHYLITI